MFKKLLPFVVMAFVSACSNMQSESNSANMCIKIPCCEQCECCKSEKCGDCCKDEQCSCCKAGSCTMCRGVKEGKTFTTQIKECSKCSKAERDGQSK